MKKMNGFRKIIGVVCGVMLCGSGLFAQDEVFLSLTRKAEKIKYLPTNISVITAEKIKEKGAKNLGEVVGEEAGINIGRYGSLGSTTHISMRGSSASQVLVLVDGIRVNELSSGQIDLSSIPLSNVDKIEIIRGGASSLYGANALGGVINIMTKRARYDVPVFDFEMSFGDLNTESYSRKFQIKKERLSTVLSVSENKSDGYRNNSGYKDLNIFGQFGFNTKSFGNFDLSVNKFNSEVGVPGTGPSLDLYDGTVEKQASSPNAKQKEDKTNIRLANTSATGIGDVSASAYISSRKRSYYNPDSWTVEDDDYKDRVFGGDVHVENSINTTVGCEWIEEGFIHTSKVTNTDVTDVSRVTSALYGQQKLVLNKFIFIPSMRFDMNSSFGNVFSPHLSAVFGINDFLKLSANIGQAWRAPSFNDSHWPVTTANYISWATGNPVTSITKGNRDIKPEKGMVYDLGAEYKTDAYKASITGFLIETEKLIQWDVEYSPDFSVETWMPVNVNKARQEGVEAVFKQKIISGLYHSVNYTYLWAVDTENKTVLNYKPCNTANYSISYMLPTRTKFGADAQYVSRQETSSYTPPLPEYATLNLSVSQTIDYFQVWLRVDNVTDKKYQTRYQYPLPGRVVYAGINLKFMK